MEFDIVNTSDRSALDTSVFTLNLSGDLGATQSLSVYTEDFTKIKTYELIVIAWFTNYASNIGERFFEIEIEDDCENDLSLTAPSPSDILYSINSGNMNLPAFTDFLNSPDYCPISYLTSISPTLPSSTTVSLD